MSFALWTACACLASFAAVAGLAAMAARAAGGRVSDSTGGDAGRAARRLFVLRVLPGLAGAAFALGLTLPAFLLFEPRDSSETGGAAFALLAVVGALAIAQGLARGARDWSTSRRLHRTWTREGRPLILPGAPVPAFRIRHPFPVVSIVGIARPRLFVAEQVLERLSPAELRAVLAHEAGHVRAADNLKRLLVRLCPALPWRSAARELERRWEQAAEEAADARAGSPFDLAAALVKTARLAPPGAQLEMPVASFHEGSALARRVRRLMQPARAGGMAPSARPRGAARLVAALVVVAIGLAPGPPALLLVHRLVEALVHLP